MLCSLVSRMLAKNSRAEQKQSKCKAFGRWLLDRHGIRNIFLLLDSYQIEIFCLMMLHFRGMASNASMGIGFLICF